MTMENTLGLGLVRQPKTVLFGPGQRRQLGRYARGFGTRALVVTDARMATTSEFAVLAEDLRECGLAVSVYDQAEPDLPRRNVMEVAETAGAVDVIIGVGGGSCMDLAKAASAVLAHGGDVRDYFGEFAVPGPCIPVITIPTTGGTGAEVTSLAIVFDEDTGMKMAVADAHIEPAIAIIDPELTLTCPPGLTAATAADALSHLVEAYTAKPKNPSPEQIETQIYVGKNRITDMFCEKGLRLMNRSLARVVENPDDLAARSDVMFAAYCAGMAINTTGTAAAHAIQSPMAAIGHTSHGFGVGALLPYVMRLNLPYATAEFAEMAHCLDVADAAAAPEENGRAAIERIEALLEQAGTPLELKSLGIEERHLDQIARSAVKATRLVLNNPAPLTEDAVRKVLARGLAGDRSWWA
ncbi:iron-containing alcohol dehydrogenase [Martelella mediterranea]|uniref:NAD-dependent methanol dehydrogenase n=1 Tax=Martelella mediterranea DSM 17316 TaxID=1122214 RepID=A0A1U9YXK1_9HYPH|nr:iron-containing alcohol dehydrogenase [Martelella mediterranea]AQZ50167.1 NAD-dependent methanol dehydrogenase [Martelella mediterranea DSM 17316]